MACFIISYAFIHGSQREYWWANKFHKTRKIQSSVTADRKFNLLSLWLWVTRFASTETKTSSHDLLHIPPFSIPYTSLLLPTTYEYTYETDGARRTTNFGSNPTIHQDHSVLLSILKVKFNLSQIPLLKENSRKIGHPLQSWTLFP
jgi:hypothetical protein